MRSRLSFGNDQAPVLSETQDVETVRISALLGEPLVELTRDDEDVLAEDLGLARTHSWKVLPSRSPPPPRASTSPW